VPRWAAAFRGCSRAFYCPAVACGFYVHSSVVIHRLIIREANGSMLIEGTFFHLYTYMYFKALQPDPGRAGSPGQKTGRAGSRARG